MAADAKLLAQIELVGDIDEWIVDAVCDPTCDAYRGPNGGGCSYCTAKFIADKLTAAGRLLPPGGEVKTQWAVRWHLVGGGVDEQDCYRNARETAEQRARRLAARPPMGVERGEALMRRIYTGPWSPVSDNSSET